MEVAQHPLSLKHLLMLLGILILTGVVFYNTASHEFILGWDDQDQVVHNDDIKKLDSKNIKTIFSSFYVGMYQPLTTLSYAINYRLSGLNPSTYHQTNLVLHLFNIILVFFLFYFFTKRIDLPIIISLLFAIHPLNVETVVWVSTRSNLLYSFFYIAALISYVKYIDSKKALPLILTLLFFIFSLLSKASAITLPFLLILFDLFNGRKINIKSLIEKVPFFLLTFGFLYIAFIARMEVSHIGSLRESFNFLDRIVLIAYAFVFYVIHLFLPFNLSAIHYYPVISLAQVQSTLGWEYYLSAILFFAILVYVIKLIKDAFVKRNFSHPILFGIGFFVLSIFVVIHFVPIGLQIVAERYVYIPFLGLFYIIAFYTTKLHNKIKWRFNWVYPLFGIVVAFFSYISYGQVDKWKNSEALMSEVIDQNPEVWHAYLVRGDGYYLNQDYPNALEDYAAAISFHPNNVSTYVNRANVYAKQREYQKAILDLDIAVSLNEHDYPNAYFNRGLAKFNLNNYGAAIEDFNKVILLKKDFSLAYMYRGVSKGILNQIDDAIIDLEKAIDLNPENPEAYYSLGTAKLRKKEYNSAFKLLNTAISLNPKYAEAYLQRGMYYILTNQKDPACVDFNHAYTLGNKTAYKFISKYCGQ